MDTNVGTIDRWIRGVIGIALIVYPIEMMHTMWGLLIGAVGMLLLITAIASICPVYALLGISTAGHGHGGHGGGHGEPHPE